MLGLSCEYMYVNKLLQYFILRIEQNLMIILKIVFCIIVFLCIVNIFYVIDSDFDCIFQFQFKNDRNYDKLYVVGDKCSEYLVIYLNIVNDKSGYFKKYIFWYLF